MRTYRISFKASANSFAVLNLSSGKYSVAFMHISINLVDFHGQHSHQKLLNIDNHIEYLDAYGDYQIELHEVRKIFNNIVYN